MLMFIFGFIAGAAVVSIGAFLVVRTVYNDAERGQVYKPAYKEGEAVILDKHEEDSYHLN